MKVPTAKTAAACRQACAAAPWCAAWTLSGACRIAEVCVCVCVYVGADGCVSRMCGCVRLYVSLCVLVCVCGVC